MKTLGEKKPAIVSVLGLVLAVVVFCRLYPLFGQAARTDGGALWIPSQLIQPDQLAARIPGTGENRPLIVFVGYSIFYKSKRIPGAVYAGPADRPQGLDLLRRTVKTLPKTREIIIYCGCCPWDICPNVKPAFQLLRDSGFSQVKVLKLSTNFLTDWINRGCPVDKNRREVPADTSK
jgi:hypothetical protein